MAMLKSVADNGSPCLTPVWTSNFSVNSLFIFTIAFVPVSISAINFFSFDGVLYCFRLSITLFLLIESKACIKSTNILWRSVLYSWHFSKVWRTVNILSSVDLFGLKPD
jgi:hypothetical protein